jgi:hypothetical protein
MALDPVTRTTVKKIANAFREYAATQGWSPQDYQIFIRINPDWGQVHVLFVAKTFPDPDTNRQWMNMMKGIEGPLPDIMENLASLDLTLRTFDQVNEGGIYSIGTQFVDIDEVLAGGAVAL